MSALLFSDDFYSYGGNLSHFKVGLLDYFTFITSSAGLDMLTDIIMTGVCNKPHNEKIWKFIKCLYWLKIGVTILDDNEGTIDAIETQCEHQHHNASFSLSNEKRMFLQRIYQAMMIVFINTRDNEKADWQACTFNKTLNVNNINLSEYLDIQRIDVLCSKLINDIKKKKGPTTVWLSLKYLYNYNNNDNSNDDELNIKDDLHLLMASQDHDNDDDNDDDTRKTRTIKYYTYDKDDIIAMNHFFSSSSTHKVTCCNPKHRDRNPSMHLYHRPSVWISRVKKFNPTKEEIEYLNMQESEATESNVSTFRGSKILLFIVSAHCYSCNYHVHFLSKSDLRKMLSDHYIKISM